MTRAELTEKLLGIKREKGWTWKYICDEIGGMSPVLITGAVLGQMKMTKPQAAKAAEMFGLSKVEQTLLRSEIHLRRDRRHVAGFDHRRGARPDENDQATGRQSG